METLHLNLKKKWFDMILNDTKTEEYRDIKPFYMQRVIDMYCGRFLKYDIQGLYHFVKNLNTDLELCKKNILWRHYDTITFSNGFAIDRPQLEIELKSIEIKEGFEKWGAEKDKKYFVLRLGKIIRTGYNLKNGKIKRSIL